MNHKLEKVCADIGKAQAKMADLQAKLDILEARKTEIENQQIVAIVRSERISDAELHSLMQTLRGKKEEQYAE